MSALCLRDLTEKTYRGLRGRVEQGRSSGGLAYGYDVVTDQGEGVRDIQSGGTVYPAYLSLSRMEWLAVSEEVCS